MWHPFSKNYYIFTCGTTIPIKQQKLINKSSEDLPLELKIIMGLGYFVNKLLFEEEGSEIREWLVENYQERFKKVKISKLGEAKASFICLFACLGKLAMMDGNITYDEKKKFRELLCNF